MKILSNFPAAFTMAIFTSISKTALVDILMTSQTVGGNSTVMNYRNFLTHLHYLSIFEGWMALFTANLLMLGFKLILG